jgi:hypothetical protein
MAGDFGFHLRDISDTIYNFSGSTQGNNETAIRKAGK